MTEETGKSGLPAAGNKYGLYIGVALLLFAAYVFIMNAWVCDDAYITFRTIDNFVNGFGLRWNIAERVQSYTHPLWLFILSFIYLMHNEIFFTSIIISLIFVLAASVLLIFKISANVLNSVIAILFMVISKAFIDYTSSGLENPLSYFLIAVFVLFYLKSENNRILKLSLTTSFIFLTRPDLILIFIPALMYETLRQRKIRSVLKLLAGLIPVFLWEVFSLIYYGFPFANTAYAKLNTGIPLTDYIIQGFSYFQNSLSNDPVTLLIIAVFVVYSFYRFITSRDARLFAAAPGVIFYLLYILYIGGDFMSGRFFAVPFFFSAAILAAKVEYPTTLRSKISYTAVITLLLAAGLLTGKSPVYSGPDYGMPRYHSNQYDASPFTDKHLITDERAFYYPYCGLIPVMKSGKGEPMFEWAELGKKSRETAPNVLVTQSTGMFGYYAGPDNYIIDEIALSDAFLARLPQDIKGRWRIGHIVRKIPDGYIRSKIADKDLLTNKGLREYYDNIELIITGGIFDKDRLAAIWSLNSGSLDHLLTDNYRVSNFPAAGSGDSVSLSDYYNDLSLYYFYAANPDIVTAIKYAMESIKYDPGDTYAYLNLGVYYLKGMKDKEKALIVFKRLLRVDQKFKEAYPYLIDIFNSMNMPDSSEHYLKIYNQLKQNE